tara:strand:- start:291 stop:647 length:357 start_codon:yes stop_codon:yes gene_type:complete
MNKITLTIALVFGFTIANAQDTTCTYFTGLRVIEFDYHKTEILYEEKNLSEYFDVYVRYGDVLCLHLNDEKNYVREVIVTYFDLSTQTEILDSKDHVYFSPKGIIKASVGKPKLAIKL